jgi:hypothetical protein
VTFARSAPAQSAPDCSVSGCARPAECSGLCAMHRKRAQRGTDPGKPVQQKLSPWGRLFEAFTQMLEAETAAEDDADFARLEARAYKAAQRWAEHGCPLPASMQLADSVPRVVDAAERGRTSTEQPASGSGRAAAVAGQEQAVAEGRERQPGRIAEGGADRPRRGSGLRSGRDCPTGRPDVPGRKPAGRQGGSRLDSRPRRTAAVLHRARKARVDLP